MEPFKIQFCRLCHNSITDVNFKVIDDVTKEILNFLMMNSDAVDKHVMCSTCSEKLNAGFDFKSTCLYTNSVIDTYVDFKNLVPVDLKEIYMKENEISDLVDAEICRLCMQPVKKQFISIHEVDVEIFQRFIPEVASKLGATTSPVICKLCVDALIAHSCFVKNCLDVEKNVERNCSDETSDGLRDISNLHFSIKPEIKDEVIKSETYSNRMEEMCEGGSIKTEEIQIKCEYNENDSLKSFLHLEDVPEINATTVEHVVLKKNSLADEFEDGHKYPEKKLYQFDVCNYSSTTKDHLQNHMLIHKDVSEWYECNICDYKANHKSDLNKHLLIHQSGSNISNIRWFSCDLCHYKTKWKRSLREHVLLHKHDSEIEWYQCEVCDYKAKNKRYLSTHMLKHKDALEIRWHECEICDYKTKLKSSLNRHMLKHKDTSETQWLECDLCDYKSKLKSILKEHMLFHRDASGIVWYECQVCDYKTKRKHLLKTHMLHHLKTVKVQWYECDVCDYKTKVKFFLTKHMIKHKDPSEAQWYRCEVCDFQSKRQDNMRKHLLIHKDTTDSDVQWFQCQVCDSKSKNKQSLDRHMITHKEASEIQWLKCDVCDYKSKTKQVLKQHMLTQKYF